MSKSLILCIFFVATLASGGAWAERRVALVVGNGAYASVPKLINPTNDAAAMEAMFNAAKFDRVVRSDDLGAAQMRRALRDFADEARDADIAVVFYAGHGMEMNGTNYLIPVDAVLERDIDVADEAISLDRINLVLEPAKRLRLVILDACRDNPFLRSMKRTLSGRAVGRGLAPIEVATTDTLIAYAAKAGSTASDGNGTNSPYTLALTKFLTTPGLDIRIALGRVRDEVMNSTSRKQEPFLYGSLGGAELSLVPKSERPAMPPNNAARDWQAVKDTNSLTVLERFLTAHQDDLVYSALAQEKIERIRSEQRALLEKRQADEDAARKAEERLEAAEREKLAAVQPEAAKAPAAAPPVPTQPLAPVNRPDIARGIQAELKRLGCYSGPIDGDWGRASKQALTEFGRRTQSDVAAGVPTPEILMGLVQVQTKTCSPTCQSGDVLVGGKCVPSGSVGKAASETKKPRPAASESNIPGPGEKCRVGGGFPVLCLTIKPENRVPY